MQIAKKTFMGILLLAILATTLVSYIVYSATPTTTFNISGGLYPGTPEYTIWKESTNYFAKTKYGQILYSGTNGSTVFQNVIDALKTTSGSYNRSIQMGSVYIKDDLILDSAINLTNISDLHLFGDAKQATNISIQSSANVIFDLTNSRSITVRDLSFTVCSGYTPGIVFLLARDTFRASVGDSLFENCLFYDNGGVTVAYFYNFGSELNNFNFCTFDVKGRMFYITYNNNLDAASTFATISTNAESTSLNTFDSCLYYCGDSTDDAIYITDSVYHMTWDKCYFGGGSNYAFNFNCTDGYIYAITVRDCHFEMLGFNGTNISGTTKGLTGFTFIHNTIAYGTGGNTYDWFNFNVSDAVHLKQAYILDNKNTQSNVVLRLEGKTIDYSEINFRAEVYRFEINVYQYVRYSRIIVYNSTYITASGGYVAVNGTYYSNGAMFP